MIISIIAVIIFVMIALGAKLYFDPFEGLWISLFLFAIVYAVLLVTIYIGHQSGELYKIEDWFVSAYRNFLFIFGSDLVWTH